MTRNYEALIILKSVGTEAELAQAVAQVEEPIKKLGGRVEHSENMGRRRLAYRIARQQEGCYQLIRFQLAPEQLEELKRALRLNETIVRYLILSRENGRPVAPVPVAVEAKASA
ncbi:MAG: 30S ribosomal protein S6 [Candidatus Omnitrophica bacterium]|nr:30S ribosomal protein S6 [Candidatus Omnitrophota bacterium]